MLRTLFCGLGRKVAPNFFHSFQSLQKICHAFRARTFDIFCSLRGNGQTHTKQSACTRFRLLYTLRGAAVQPSLLFFVRAFVPAGSPRNPARQQGRACPHKMSTLIAKRVPRISFAVNVRQAFARVIPPVRQVRQDSSYHFRNSFTCHSLPHARFTCLSRSSVSGRLFCLVIVV